MEVVILLVNCKFVYETVKNERVFYGKEKIIVFSTLASVAEFYIDNKIQMESEFWLF